VPWWKLTHPKTGMSNLEIAQQRFSFFLCPADDPYQSTEATIVGTHVIMGAAPPNGMRASFLHYDAEPLARGLGRTNYLGVAGSSTMGSAGVFGNRSKLTLGQIAVSDGTSNTLMFGETSGGNAQREDRGRRFAFSWCAGALPTDAGLASGRRVPWYAFGSRHYRSVNFAWADGSVRGMRFTRSYQEWAVLQSLAGYRDGGVYEPLED
jgi:prepilin-type processing-associated H-X9-DG protein